MVPAEVSFDQSDSNRSMCGSDAGISSKNSSKGKARVSKVTKRRPQEYITDSKQRLAALGPQAFFDDMMSRKRELQWNRTPSPVPMKNTEEDFLTPEKDTAVFAGTANPHLVMGPGMEAGSLPEAECLTFRAHMGGDTLDAFAPLA